MLWRWNVAVTLATSVLELVPEVYAVTSDDARVAVRLLEEYASQGVQARDVLHAAVMRRHGIRRIISTDQHLDVIAGFERLDPLDVRAEGLGSRTL